MNDRANLLGRAAEICRIEGFIAEGDACVAAALPIDMVLHCPQCGEQHIDAEKIGLYVEKRNADGDLYMHREHDWLNLPHRSHLCANCRHVWRPADVATNGVARVQTRGKDDHGIVRPIRFAFSGESDVRGQSVGVPVQVIAPGNVGAVPRIGIEPCERCTPTVNGGHRCTGVCTIDARSLAHVPGIERIEATAALQERGIM